MDRCLRCFAPHRRVSYCENCGRIGPTSIYHDYDHTYYCVNHPRVVTTQFCGLCASPVCKDCQERRTEPLSSPMPIPWCFSCVRKISAIEQSFLKKLALSGVCAKHLNERAKFKCKSCELPLCPSCAYFHTKGFLRRHAGDGPYCLTCFRLSRAPSERKSWISGIAVVSNANA